MPVIQGIVKPKTRKGKRVLEKREPKLIEDGKATIFIRGQTANNVVLQILKEFCMLKKPRSVFFNKKNDLRPFEDASSLEFFSNRNDASLFMFGSHNKKRPNNIVLGRMHDHHVLDMFEFGVQNFKSLSDFKTAKIPVGTKPMLLFAGDAFETGSEFQRLKNLLIDFFRGPVVENIRLQGLEHIIVFHGVEEKVKFRSYKVLLKKSGTRVPDVVLEEIGPHMDLVLRRRKLASDDYFKQATKTPVQLKPKKKKNVVRNPLGTTHGRMHMQRQDYSKLKTRKVKGLKMTAKERQNFMHGGIKRKPDNALPPSKKVKKETA